MAEKPLDVHLAEYGSLRTEQLNRIQMQYNVVAWLLTLFAAVLTAVTFSYEKVGIRNIQWLALQVFVFLPLVTAPIAFVTFDHILMIHRLGAYIGGYLRPAIEASLATNGTPDYKVLRWDPLPGAALQTVNCIRYLAFLLGSWFFFLLLIPVPTLVVTFATWGAWPYPWLLCADGLISLAFLYNSIAIWNERAGWVGLPKIPLPF